MCFLHCTLHKNKHHQGFLVIHTYYLVVAQDPHARKHITLRHRNTHNAETLTCESAFLC